MTKEQTAFIPLIIGITGHRDISAEHVSKLKSAAAEIFDELQTSYPDTPLILLTQLAEGADTIAAEAALERGVQIIAALPMPVAEYEQDFETAESLAEFRQFIEYCTTVIELPLLDTITVEDLRNDLEKRDAQRRVSSAYIATRCELLIAMWDGIENNLAGGTSDTVRFKRDGIPTPFLNTRDPLSPIEEGPVFHVITPRIKNPNPEGVPFSVQKLYSATQVHGQDAADYYSDLFSKMNTFNADARETSGTMGEALQRNTDYLFPSEKTGMLDNDLKYIRNLFGVADTLAQRFQKRTDKILGVIFILALISALAFDLYSHLFSENPEVLGLFLLLLGTAYLIYMRINRKGYERKYLDYRAVAEGLRVQFFWRLSGVRAIASDYYLRKQLNILAWIRNAIQVTELTALDNAPDTNSEHTLRNIQATLEHWVDDQKKYFTKSSTRSEHRLEKHEFRINVLFGLGVSLAVILFVLQYLHALEHNYLHYMLIASGVFILFAAMHHAYTQKQAYAEHARQYEQMGRMFGIASTLLQNHITEGNINDARNILQELGMETLVENADWVVIHRDRPIEIPKG